MEKSFTLYAEKKIDQVHALSAEHNAKDKEHAKVLIELIKKHAIEIEELYNAEDEHLKIETGDLLVLCLELLKEQGAQADKIMDTCYSRYKDKLTSLIKKSNK